MTDTYNMSMPTMALMDGDMIAHRAAFVAADVESVGWTVRQIVDKWTPPGVRTVKISLSDSRANNIRRDYWADYKAHRDGLEVDEGQVARLEEAKTTMESDFDVRFVERYEADDLMGVAASAGKAVAVTLDKDLLSTPGWHYRPEYNHWGSQDENGIRMQVTKPAKLVRVSQQEADHMFYCQWLMGDMTDNYPGLKGIGEKKAEKILAQHSPNNWESAVLHEYETRGYDWDYCLAMGRCARILRLSDWQNGRVFTPCASCVFNRESPN